MHSLVHLSVRLPLQTTQGVVNLYGLQFIARKEGKEGKESHGGGGGVEVGGGLKQAKVLSARKQHHLLPCRGTQLA